MSLYNPPGLSFLPNNALYLPSLRWLLGNRDCRQLLPPANLVSSSSNLGASRFAGSVVPRDQGYCNLLAYEEAF